MKTVEIRVVKFNDQHAVKAGKALVVTGLSKRNAEAIAASMRDRIVKPRKPGESELGW